MKNILLVAIAIFLFTSCFQKPWEKTDSGIIIHLRDKTGKSAKLLKLEPVTDQIIHVTASPATKFSKDKSLCVIDDPSREVKYDVIESNGALTLSTSKIKAVVSLNTGQVIYKD
jgi:alpha-D-xyloside xylohydrolase